jgi:hypothetical protein
VLGELALKQAERAGGYRPGVADAPACAAEVDEVLSGGCTRLRQ